MNATKLVEKLRRVNAFPRGSESITGKPQIKRVRVEFVGSLQVRLNRAVCCAFVVLREVVRRRITKKPAFGWLSCL